jgi:hypothetical protein
MAKYGLTTFRIVGISGLPTGIEQKSLLMERGLL